MTTYEEPEIHFVGNFTEVTHGLTGNIIDEIVSFA